MKRYISIIVVLLLSLYLFSGCGSAPAESTEAVHETTVQTSGTEPAIPDAILPATFCVGYAKADITPIDPVPLGGYGDHETRISRGFLEYLYATCVAFSDADGNRLLLIAHDLGSSRQEVFDPIREQIARENGIPGSHIHFAASHSHSSPYTTSTAYENVSEYIALVRQRIAEGAKAALADLKPATMETGFQRVDRLNTVRHYLLTNGKYQGRAVGTLTKDKLVGHYGKVDNLLQVVKFTREGDKPVVMVNWAGHPTGMNGEGYYYASPNYPGALRTELEATHNCYAAFVLSGSGNVNNGSQIASEIDYRKGEYKVLGKLLADRVGEILKNGLTPGKADRILVSENIMQSTTNKLQVMDVPLYAFSVGDWACVAAPFEIFDTNAMAVRDASPYRMTFYASCANGALGYLPTPPSFDWEITYEAEITKFPKGMAETVQDALIGQLRDIFAQSGNTETEKPDGYLTPEFVPTSDEKIYINPAPGEMGLCQEVNNGFYAVMLASDSNIRTMLCIDKSVAEKVVAQAAMKLIFNEQNVIVDVIPQ